MKTIKIFVLPSHTFVDRVSGVDYVRVTQPMTHLKDYVYKDTKFDVTVYNPRTDESFDWVDVFEEYDIVYFNYTSNDVGYAIMGCLAQKYDRKLVCDFDDDLWEILKDNVAFDTFKEGTWGRIVVTAIAGDVAHVTVTNKHLKNSLVHHTEKKASEVTITPNYIDLDLYKYRCKFKNRPYIKALHFGSSSHFASLASDIFFKAVDRIMKEYPNFSFTSIGAFIPSYKDRWGARYAQGYGDTDLMKWIAKMPSIMDAHDFMLVPLNNNTYNRSKSSIKFLEASSFKIPGVWQNIRQYKELVEHGKNGFLCETEDEWYEAIKEMIDNAELRQSMGEEAFKTIQDWRIEKHMDKYAKMFIKLLDKK